jgi:hypothetical protein
MAKITFPHWNINAWGDPKPTYLSNNPGSHFFKLLTKGAGSAEMTLPQVLKPGRAYRLTMFVMSDAPTEANVFFRRDAAPYDVTTVRTLKVNQRWQEVTLSGIYTASTVGSVRVSVKEGAPGIYINTPTLEEISYKEVGVSPIAPSPVLPEFFGVHINKLGQHNEWPEFAPGLVRLWDTGTTWANLKPSSAAIDWDNNPYAKRLDYYVRHITKWNPNATILYTAAMTPAHAGRANARNCNNSSYGLRSCTNPVDINEWRTFIRELALRFKGLIKVWEIWNEVDIWYHWDTSAVEMLAMAKVAYDELKYIDETNTVLAPNITTVGLKWLNDYLALGGNRYCDGYSIHGYLGRSPEGAVNTLRNLRQLLNEYGISKPIWNTETGVSCNPILETCNVNTYSTMLDGDLALAQGILSNAALGVKTFAYYTWEGAALDVGGLPLVTGSDYKTPTFTNSVISNIKKWIEGNVVKFSYLDNELLAVISVTRGEKESLILWSKTGVPLLLSGSDFPEFKFKQSVFKNELGLTSGTFEVTSDPCILY